MKGFWFLGVYYKDEGEIYVVIIKCVKICKKYV